MNEDRAFASLLEAHMDDVRHWAQCRFDEALALCESPIERMLLPHLMFLRPGYLAPRYGGGLDYSGELRLLPQHKVSLKRRVDFAIVVIPHLEALEEYRVAIECDGRDYHDRTTAQVNADKERDQEILVAGYTPLHFSGSQINRDAAACAARVAQVIDAHFSERVTMRAIRRERGMSAGEAMENVVRILDPDRRPS